MCGPFYIFDVGWWRCNSGARFFMTFLVMGRNLLISAKSTNHCICFSLGYSSIYSYTSPVALLTDQSQNMTTVCHYIQVMRYLKICHETLVHVFLFVPQSQQSLFSKMQQKIQRVIMFFWMSTYNFQVDVYRLHGVTHYFRQSPIPLHSRLKNIIPHHNGRAVIAGIVNMFRKSTSIGSPVF